MSKNPIINGLSALIYIITVAFVMYFGTKNLPKEDTILAPIAMISLFTLSAGVMGYIFGLQPIQLYLDGKKKEAVKLFLKTLMVFGFLTAFMLLLLFTRIFS
jgi:hypothetical protein